MQEWVRKHGFGDDKALLDYAYALSLHYGQAIGALACQMYEKTAAAQGVIVPTAEIADLPEYGEVARAVHGTMKQSQSKVPATVARLVKQVGADTTLKNAKRDGAQFAWIPHGDTCAFCITLASRGWQYMSDEALKGGHAEHIHANCDCEYAVRFDGHSTVAGYDPDKYLEEYENAISYYKDAIKVTLDDKNREASDKSLSVINGAHAYIKLGQYEKAIVWLQQLDEWIPNLEAYARDDIEILKNDILAKAEIHNEQFEKAEEYLENAAALLENDDEEFSSKKDVYVNLTYAELYMAQTRYEEALSLYEQLLSQSAEEELGLEEVIYQQMCKIYQERNDFENYKKYSTLYSDQIIKNNKNFSKTYVSSIREVYQYQLLAKKEGQYQVALLVNITVILGLLVIVVWTVRSRMKSRKMSFTDSMTGLFNRKYLTYYLEKNRKNYGKNRLLFLLLILTILKSITIITDMFKEILR